jgi:hypothetical protein
MLASGVYVLHDTLHALYSCYAFWFGKQINCSRSFKSTPSKTSARFLDTKAKRWNPSILEIEDIHNFIPTCSQTKCYLSSHSTHPCLLPSRSSWRWLRTGVLDSRIVVRAQNTKGATKDHRAANRARTLRCLRTVHHGPGNVRWRGIRSARAYERIGVRSRLATCAGTALSLSAVRFRTDTDPADSEALCCWRSVCR